MKLRHVVGVLLAAVLATVSLSAAAVCQAPLSGLVNWWRAEGNGADVVGSYNGARMLGAGFAAGQHGQAFNLDGVDDYVHVGMLGNIGVNEADPFSVSLWVNALELTRNSPQVIASNYMGERGGTGDYYTYLFTVMDQLYFGVGKRQLAGITVYATLPAGWHLVTGTYDGSSVSIYVDGVLVETGTRPFSDSVPNTRGWNFGDFSPETNWSHLTLGGADRNGAFTGQLDEIQVFDRALTADEVASLYQAAGDVCGSPTPTLDIDGNALGGKYTALTDGVLALRYLLGLSGPAMTAGATGDNPARDDSAMLLHLDNMRWALDVDDSGVADAATDGLMILRYLLGFRGNALIADALGTNAGRTTPAAIESWLATLTP